MANEQPIAGVDVAALIARATIVKDGSIAALRDEARDHGRMPFKVRDMHVMALHNTYRELFAALDALTREQAEQQAEEGRWREEAIAACNKVAELQAEIARTGAMCSALAGDVQRLTNERNEASSQALEAESQHHWTRDYLAGAQSQIAALQAEVTRLTQALDAKERG